MKHTPTALDKVVIMQKYNDSDKVLECRKEFEEAENTIVHAVKMHSELVTALEECYSTINQLGYLSGDKLYQHNLTRIKEVLDKAERK